MLTKVNFTKEWLEEQMAEMKKRGLKADSVLVERNIHAFHLLEKLKENGLEFIFKGGTALILLIKEPIRFSIDIDIQMKPVDSNDSLTAIFELIIEGDGPFKTFEENVRDSTDIPKKHYKFFYDSIKEKNIPMYVLLDIVFDEETYTDLIEVPIKNALVKTCDPEVTVICPSLFALLGDKMTAFAPNTIGIPYDIGKDVEIIKQMFDVSRMTNKWDETAFEVVERNFHKSVEQNARFRGLDDLKPEDVLNDIIDTALTIVLVGKYKELNFEKLKTGIKNIRNYIHGEKYTFESALKDSGRVAHLAASMLHGFEFKNYEVGDVPEITQEMNYRKRLSVIRKIDLESYYHWAHVMEYVSD